MEKEIIDEIIERGYDCFINEQDIVMTKNGFTYTVSLENTLKLMENQTILHEGITTEFPGATLTDIIAILMNNHKVKHRYHLAHR